HSTFSFTDPAITAIYTLSLHDALPICPENHCGSPPEEATRLAFAMTPRLADMRGAETAEGSFGSRPGHFLVTPALPVRNPASARSEEHTSELQSRFDLVCRLLLEKKKA